MRQLFWSNVSHISAAFVALSAWGVVRLTRATGAAYAKPRAVALALGVIWLTLLMWALYSYPGMGPFAAALTVTLFADNHYLASLARSLGQARFHERLVEPVRQLGIVGFLRLALPGKLLHLGLAGLLIGLSAGPRDWFYWVALGFAMAHAMSILSTIHFAFKYREQAS